MSDDIEKRLAEIRARLAAATPGSWRAELEPGNDRVIWDRNGDWVANVHSAGDETNVIAFDQSAADTVFIANAPADIAWLLELVADAERRKAT